MNSPDRIDCDALAKVTNLSDLTPTQLERLAATMSVADFSRRQKIFAQDETAARVYLVVSGIVRISFKNRDDRSVLVTLLPAGQFFGIGSLFLEARHPFSSEAFTDCTIGTIEPDKLIEILLGIPFHVHLRYTNVIVGRVWRMYLHCVEGTGLSLRKHLALELLEMAASVGLPGRRGTIISPSPTHQDLADSIGASRQKVSECLAAFQRRQIIMRDKHGLIVNPEKLRKIIDKDDRTRI